MFRNSFQQGFLTVLFSGGSNPLKIWDRMVVNGHVKRVTDEDVRALVLEMCGTNVATCYIYAPIDSKQVLGIKLPFLVMIIKNLKKYFSFEVTILDDRNIRRRFRVSNYQSTTKVRPFGTTMPIGLNPGWNQIQFNLADFTKRAYGSTYLEVQRMQIHANCRIRRIYFSDRLYPEDELPNEYKLFYPVMEDRLRKKEEPKRGPELGPPPSEAGDEIEVAAEASTEMESPPPEMIDIVEAPIEDQIEETQPELLETEEAAHPEVAQEPEEKAEEEPVPPEVDEAEGILEEADEGEEGAVAAGGEDVDETAEPAPLPEGETTEQTEAVEE